MIRRKIAKYLAGRKYIIEILENPTDLSEFNERPTKRLITGLILMGLSYVIGWPAVAALTVLATWFREPMIAVIGCPTTYGLSYLVFIVGAWLARAPHYMGTLARYTIQLFLRKLLS
jgi:CHASE2 domain-containing sensor protein